MRPSGIRFLSDTTCAVLRGVRKGAVRRQSNVGALIDLRTKVKKSSEYIDNLSALRLKKWKLSLPYQKYRKRLAQISFAKTLAFPSKSTDVREICDALDAVDANTPVIARSGYRYLINQKLSNPLSTRSDVTELVMVFLRYNSRCGTCPSIHEKVLSSLTAAGEIEEIQRIVSATNSHVDESILFSVVELSLKSGNLNLAASLIVNYAKNCSVETIVHQQVTSDILRLIIRVFSENIVLGQDGPARRMTFVHDVLQALDGYHRKLAKANFSFNTMPSIHLAALVADCESVSWADVYDSVLRNSDFMDWEDVDGFNYHVDDICKMLDPTLGDDEIINQLILDVSFELQNRHSGRNLLYSKSIWDEWDVAESELRGSMLQPSVSIFNGRSLSTRLGSGDDAIDAMKHAFEDVFLSALGADVEEIDEEDGEESDDNEDSGDDSESDGESNSESSSGEDFDLDHSFGAADDNSTPLIKSYRSADIMENFSQETAAKKKNTLLVRMELLGMSVWNDLVRCTVPVRDVTQYFEKCDPPVLLMHDDYAISSQLVDGDRSVAPNSAHLPSDGSTWCTDGEGENDSAGNPVNSELNFRVDKVDDKDV